MGGRGTGSLKCALSAISIGVLCPGFFWASCSFLKNEPKATGQHSERWRLRDSIRDLEKNDLPFFFFYFFLSAKIKSAASPTKQFLNCRYSRIGIPL